MTVSPTNNPLRALPSEPKKLRKALAGLSGDIVPYIEDLLFDAYISADLIRRLQQAFEMMRDSSHEKSYSAELFGGIAFFLFSRAAYDAVYSRRFTECNEYIGRDQAMNFFKKLYELPNDLLIEQLEMLELGTTSFIFRCHSNLYGEHVIKAIQYRYTKIESIARATNAYKTTYRLKSDHAPRIFQSHQKWIIMELVPGMTLEKFIRDHASDGPELSKLDVKNIGEIYNRLCEILSYYCSLTTPIYHLDLSPRNVMVRVRNSEVTDLKLIDFGRNYLLQERVGSGQMFAEAEIYVAPELLVSPQVSGIKPDIYSLGMIFLEMVTKKPLSKEHIGPRLQFTWETMPGFAKLVEDMIDENPDNRLVMWDRRGTESAYQHIRTRIAEELRVYEEIFLRGETILVTGLQYLGGFFTPTIKNFLQIVSVPNASRKAGRSLSNLRYLRNWAILAEICYGLTVSLVAYLTLVDLGILVWPDAFNYQDGTPVVAYQPGSFWENLPGRLVVFTSGLVATKYYLNIFGTITARGLDHRWSNIAEFFMRANSCSFVGPALYAALYDPKAWPACYFIALLFVGANNWFCWLLAKDAVVDSRAHFSTEQISSSDRFLREYSEWWILIFVYAAAVLIVGALLGSGFAEDEFIYAITVAVAINILNMYRKNCGKLAPFVRGNLTRLFYSLRRIQSLAGQTAL